MLSDLHRWRVMFFIPALVIVSCDGGAGGRSSSAVDDVISSDAGADAGRVVEHAAPHVPVIGCLNPRRSVVGGEDTGFVLCEGYFFHRPESLACPVTDPTRATQCLVDGDCDDDEACVCSSNGGYCVPADCWTDEDCPGERLCVTYRQHPDACFYGSVALACQAEEDHACEDSAGCSGELVCMRARSSSGVRKVCLEDPVCWIVF